VGLNDVAKPPSGGPRDKPPTSAGQSRPSGKGRKQPAGRQQSRAQNGSGKTGRMPPGVEARALAADLIGGVLIKHQSLDEAMAAANSDGATALPTEARDRGFARLLAATVLRRHGQLKAVVDSYLDVPLKEAGRRAEIILLMGAAQLLYLETPPHAVIDTAVTLSRRTRSTGRFAGLINAVLRRISESGAARLGELDPAEWNIPEWMLDGWRQAYGEEAAHAIALACLSEPALDITPRSDAAAWADRLGGVLLQTGSIRRRNDGRIEALEGYDDGAWWVQDAAAALPARLLGDLDGKLVADLCAAPGGKTAQLAAAGAQVTAVDISERRLERVSENLKRLALTAELITADVAQWAHGRQFDAVLLDAPCTATGTIRRHPDILHLKRPEDREKLGVLQEKLLGNAAGLVRPGGVLVYCTCSLEPEEGEGQITAFLDSHEDFSRAAITAGEVGGVADFITPAGDLRTLPCHFATADAGLSGVDGFYACRLVRSP
jgi:16S rRNA (cytosine967-C5)-methyltransferase